MVQKLRNLTQKYAIPSAIAIALVFYVLMLGVSKIFGLMPASVGKEYVHEIVSMLYPIGIVILFGFSSAFGRQGFFKTLICGMLLLALQTFSLLFSIIENATSDATAWQPWYVIILGVISVISIGIREECVFRATIQGVLAKKYANSVKGIWLTALLSALIFGLIHSFNIFAGVDPIAALVQSVTNVGIGMFWAALYLRCRNLWALVLIHAITDASGLFTALFCQNVSDTDVMSNLPVASLISGVVFFLLGFYLLRASKCKEIIEYYNRENEVQCEGSID